MQRAEVKSFGGPLAAEFNNPGLVDHPVILGLNQPIRDHFATNNVMLRHTFGDHMVSRLAMERQIASSFQRLPILKSENIALDTLTGKDLELQPGEYIHRHETPDYPEQELHQIMEKKLGLGVATM
mmetsp:Transcript_8099/g.8971  ORF Transcript_8099/g.8971 Transcript_8099/m.8971 type:complete len:126 (+) Transcript_8099:40-417(+)